MSGTQVATPSIGYGAPSRLLRRRGAPYRSPVLPRPVCDLPARQCLLYTLGWQMAAFAVLAGQLVLLSAAGPATLAIGLVGLVTLFAYRPLAGATVFLQLLLYQNLVLSIFSDTGIEKSSFVAFQGFSFGAAAGMAAVAVVRITKSADRASDVARVVRWTCVCLAVVVAYTCYGAVRSSPVSALIYFRNSAAVLMVLLIGLDVGRVWGYRTLATIFLASVAIGLLFAFSEYWFPREYYSAIHARHFISMKWPDMDRPAISRSVDDILAARVVAWFNITGGAGDALSVRIFGPNMEAISYAYVIAVAGVVATTLGRLSLTALALGLLVVVAVKGSLIMLVLSLVIYTIWRVVKRPPLVLLASLLLVASYVIIGISTGMRNGDFHVIGLLGGVSGFIHMPWGHGIGVGGNLSDVALKRPLAWEVWQKTGVDFALESAVGVLLYQMGIAAAAIYVPIIALLRRGLAVGSSLSRSVRATGAPEPVHLLFIAIGCTLVNGLFQEEAYSPYSLGLLTFLGGVAVAHLSANKARRGLKS